LNGSGTVWRERVRVREVKEKKRAWGVIT